MIAPDKFKSTLDARAVAEAMARGVRAARPNAKVDIRPMADGGEGTVDALTGGSAGARIERVRVEGPVGDPVQARLVWPDNRSAVAEMASASGLVIDPATPPRPLRADSFGTGQLILAALSRGAQELMLGLGGSATTDGGTGAARALGWRFLDRRGQELSPGGGALVHLARVDSSAALEVGPGRLVGLCDVDNPLVGPRGAARAFAAQKGATDDEIEVLAGALETLAARIEADTGIEVARVQHAGAAGGMGAGLLAFFNGRLEPGFGAVSRLTGLPALIEGASLVITGEGSLDDQSLRGKTVVGVARLAAPRRVPCLAIAGRVGLSASVLDAERLEALDLVREVGIERAMSATGPAIATVTERWIRSRFGG